jgi:hypothetical protein
MMEFAKQNRRVSLQAASQYKLCRGEGEFPNVIVATLHFDKQPQLFLRHFILQVTTASVTNFVDDRYYSLQVLKNL